VAGFIDHLERKLQWKGKEKVGGGKTLVREELGGKGKKMRTKYVAGGRAKILRLTVSVLWLEEKRGKEGTGRRCRWEHNSPARRMHNQGGKELGGSRKKQRTGEAASGSKKWRADATDESSTVTSSTTRTDKRVLANTRNSKARQNDGGNFKKIRTTHGKRRRGCSRQISTRAGTKMRKESEHRAGRVTLN